MMPRRLVQINPVVRQNTSTGRIMREIGELASLNGWESHLAFSAGRDPEPQPAIGSQLMPVGNKMSVAMHGMATRLFDRHGLASRQATTRFINSLAELKPHIIHIHNIHGYFLNYPLLFQYLRQSCIPVVWTVHDCWLYTGHCYYYSAAHCDRWQDGCGSCPQQRKFPTSWIADRSARNYTDKKAAFTSLAPGQLTIVPVSNWIRDEMSHSFLRDQTFQVIHNGIDTDIFSPQNPAKAKTRLGVEGKRLYMGVASIWSAEKGWDDLLAMARMLQSDEQLVMVGVTQKQLTQLPDKILGIPRTENVTQLAELYSAADAFLNPTYQDNYPTVNLEAIACGTPVVTYRTGGSIEAITPATGTIVDQGDVQAMLQAARSAAKKAFLEPCRSFALNHFKKQDRYRDYLNLYNRLIE